MEEYYHASLDLEDDWEERIENLSKAELEKKIVNPYKQGTEIFINGTSINPYDIVRIHLRKTDEHLDVITKRLEYKEELERKQRTVGIIYPYMPASQYAIWEGEDVLEEFITGSAGYERKQENHQVNNMQNNKIHWFNLLSESKIEEVLKGLKEYAFNSNDDDLIDDVINVSSRWHDIQKRVQDNTVSFDNEQTEHRKINKTITKIIRGLEIQLF